MTDASARYASGSPGPVPSAAEPLPAADVAASVTRLRALDCEPVERCAARYGARLVHVPDDEPIPHSYWGAPEAGLEGDRIYVRADTPAHSVLHELGHYVCMSNGRRERLVKDAGGDPHEECAVCYLQILLADHLPGFGRDKALDDMDAWGYSFREGSVRAWWDGDARYARAWLVERGLIDASDAVTWLLRT